MVVEPHLDLVAEAGPAGDVVAFGHEELHRAAIDVGQRVEERARLFGQRHIFHLDQILGAHMAAIQVQADGNPLA